jgi:hypothetical protein
MDNWEARERKGSWSILRQLVDQKFSRDRGKALETTFRIAETFEV